MRQMAMIGSGCSACHSFIGHCPREAPRGLGVLSIRSPSCSEPSIAPPQKNSTSYQGPMIWPAYVPSSICPPHPYLCPSRPGILSFHT